MAQRPRLWIALGLVVSAVLAGGAGVALVKASDDKGATTAAPTAAPVVTPSVTPAATPSAEPTPTPELVATLTATPSPSATAVATASSVRKYPYPKPTRGYAALFYRATNTPGTGTTDTTFTLTIKASDGDGSITFGGLTWGDGSSEAAEPVPGPCSPRPSPTTQPPPYQPDPDSRVLSYHHRYVAAGNFNVLTTVNSGNPTCRPHGAPSESQTVKLAVHVSPVATTSPTP